MEGANERKADKRLETEIVDRLRNWGTKGTLTHWNSLAKQWAERNLGGSAGTAPLSWRKLPSTSEP